MRRWCRLCLLSMSAVVLLVLGAAPAIAHVELTAASPAPDASVTEPVSVVRLTFSGALQPDGAHAVGLFAPDGMRLDSGGTILIADNVAETSVAEPLPSTGSYRVEWLVIGGDGHSISGEYTFTFDGPAAASSPTPSPPASPSPSPTAQPSPDATSPATAAASAAVETARAGDSSGGGVSPVLVGGTVAAVAAVVVVGGARRRRG